MRLVLSVWTMCCVLLVQDAYAQTAHAQTGHAQGVYAQSVREAMDRIDWQLLEARTAGELGEPQVAESHRRAASREAWTLLGAMAIAEGDLESARRDLMRARSVAAVGYERARELLALTELHLAFQNGALQGGTVQNGTVQSGPDQGGSGQDGGVSVEAALRELRFGVNERPDEAAVLRRFARALWATGRDEELRAEVETLRRLDPAVAAELEATLASSGKRSLPPLDVGPLKETLPKKAEWAILSAKLRALVEEIDTALGEGPSSADGQVDRPAPKVGPFALDPASRFASTPESLRDVLNLHDAGELEQAIQQLRGRLDGPDGTAARVLLGRLLAETGDVEAAAEPLNHAIRVDPEPLDAQQALARLYWLQDRQREALTLLRQAAFGGVLERDLAWVLAEAEIEVGRWQEAREQLTSLHKRFDSARALLRLVEVSQSEDDVKRALEAAEQALILAPSAEQVLHVHAQLTLEVGVMTRAARSVEALARMRPDAAKYQFLLGEIWRQKRKMGEASEAYLRAIALDPTLVEPLKPLGLALNHESRFAEARESLARFVAVHGSDLDALAGLAEAEERLGEVESAEQRARAVVEADAEHPRARLVLGMVASGRGEFEAARRSLERAVQADPWLAKAHYQLSFACARLRDRECARRHLALYEKALEGPESEFIQMQPVSSGQLMKRRDVP